MTTKTDGFDGFWREGKNVFDEKERLQEVQAFFSAVYEFFVCLEKKENAAVGCLQKIFLSLWQLFSKKRKEGNSIEFQCILQLSQQRKKPKAIFFFLELFSLSLSFSFYLFSSNSLEIGVESPTLRVASTAAPATEQSSALRETERASEARGHLFFKITHVQASFFGHQWKRTLGKEEREEWRFKTCSKEILFSCCLRGRGGKSLFVRGGKL